MGPADIDVARWLFVVALNVGRAADGTEELAPPDDPGLEFDLMILSGGLSRSPSAFRFVWLLFALDALLTAGLLTSLEASPAGRVGFEGVGFEAGLGGAGDWPVPIEPRTSLKKLIVLWRVQ